MKISSLTTIAALCLAALLPSCSPRPYSTVEGGIAVDIAASGDSIGAHRVRLQVVGERIIRVSAVPDGDFAADGSLVVVEQEARPPYTVGYDSDVVKVSTGALTATVDRRDGHVSFYDSDRRLILAENAGREFTPYSAGGESAYSVRQTFASPDDNEGLYGLGQHQSDEFNYKGRNEELFQYNTKVSVPFVVSTGGYGILWDSYSLVRFGRPDDYSQLGDVFTLYNKEGREGALTGTYTAADGTRLVRDEDKVYFEHLIRGDLDHVVNLPQDFPFYGSKVVYEGELEADTTGVFDFIQYYSGYQKIYIDGRLVVPERWRTAWNPNAYKFAVSMEKGRRTPIRIEWEPNGSVAYAGLRAYRPVGDDERLKMSWWGQMQDQIDYYFIAGDDMDGVIGGYRTLTGKASIMPRWAMGYWQSREKYNTSDEVLSTLAEYRRRNLPIDNIVIDWLHWPQDAWGSHKFDTARFPDPKGMVDSIHALNGRVMISVWPKFYVTTDHYREFDEHGWMYRQAVADSIRDWVGPGYLGSFYDAYSPDARRLFWSQIQDHYYPLGFDAWWMDASEPNVRDCTDIEYRKALCGPTALGPSDKYFNTYALVNADAIYNGQRGVDPDRRVFLLTRSGFAGQQRYGTATWSGDIATRWEDMKAQISAGLNFAAAGIPYWTMDIGGFCVEDRYVAAQQEYDRTGRENADLKEWRELNTRWHQFGAFAPLYRAHGQWPFREVYNIAPEGHPAYDAIAYYARLRYSLMPYIYTLAGMTHFADYTIMRPLAMDFAADTAVRNIGDQYMFGPAFLVAPVYEYGARSRSVYLPAGALWYDFYTGRPYEGGSTIDADAPYSRMPLLVRSGAIVPFGPDIQWTGERAADEITLFVYAGSDGAFTLYEDEGTNYDYEKGLCSMIPFSWDDASRTLTIGDRSGSFPGMTEARKFNIVLVDSTHPATFIPATAKAPSKTSAAPSATVDYSGKAVSVTL